MFGHGVRAFVEVLEPPLRLVICGAGHDAIPLVRAAAGVGWRPIVVDDRPAFLTHERFPQAHAFVPIAEPGEVAEAAPLDAATFAVVMTHNFLRDRDYLRGLLASAVGYIAMLGPAARTQRLLMDLAERRLAGHRQGSRADPRAGGSRPRREGPEEIAQSIVAEIVAVRHERDGGFLRSARARSTTGRARAPKPGSKVISGVVLAAGTGSRFGGTKQVVEVGGKPLVLHAVGALLDAGVSELIVVTGHDGEAVEAVLPAAVRAVRNPAYRDGQATSLAAALHEVAEDSEGAVILLADQPGIEAADVRALIDGFATTRAQMVRLRFTDGPGPALLSREIYAEAGHLHGDAGARVLAASHPEWVHEVAVDRPAPRDIDTRDDLP